MSPAIQDNMRVGCTDSIQMHHTACIQVQNSQRTSLLTFLWAKWQKWLGEIVETFKTVILAFRKAASELLNVPSTQESCLAHGRICGLWVETITELKVNNH